MLVPEGVRRRARAEMRPEGDQEARDAGLRGGKGVDTAGSVIAVESTS